MTVEIRHLRALVALSQADTYTTAAAMLGTTQPTLSRTIAQLEELTGAQLVQRTTRHMGLTAAGAQFAETAQTMLQQLDAAIQRLRSPADTPLRLGWAWAGFGKHTVPLLTQWKDHHGHSVYMSRPDDPLQALLNGDIDVALIRRSPPTDTLLNGITTQTLFTEELVAVIPANDPRSQYATVQLADFSHDVVAMCATAPTVTTQLWSFIGPAPRTVTVANTEEWLTHIAMGEAVGITAAATLHSHRSSDVNYLPIDDAPAVEVLLAWSQQTPHPRAAEFARLARQYFTQFIATSTPPLVLTADE